MQPSKTDIPIAEQLQQLRLSKRHTEGIERARSYLAQGNVPDAEFMYQLGRCYLVTGQLAEAEEQIRSAINRSPEKADFQLTLGRIAEKKGNVDEALRWYVDINARFPDYYPAINNLVRLARKLERPGLAEGCLEPFLERFPMDAQAHVLFAKCSSDPEEKQRRLTVALTQCPGPTALAAYQVKFALAK